MKEEKSGASIRNDARSGAKRVPLSVIVDPDHPEWPAVFYVSKVDLAEGLKFVKEANGVEQMQARLRHIISSLIANSYK